MLVGESVEVADIIAVEAASGITGITTGAGGSGGGGGGSSKKLGTYYSNGREATGIEHSIMDYEDDH